MLTHEENLANLMHVIPFQQLIWKKISKISLYIYYFGSEHFCWRLYFKCDSFHLKYQGMNLVSALGFIR